jgi:hypothetical protein
MRNTLAFIIASLLVGCAATAGNEYARVYDRKYNEVRLVQKESPGSFVGTSAMRQPVKAPAQHP